MPTERCQVFDYEDLFRQLEDDGHGEWIESLRTACEESLRSDRHGLLPTWLELLQQVPPSPEPSWYIEDGHVVVEERTGSGVFLERSSPALSSVAKPKKTPDPLKQLPLKQLRDFLQQFCPWRKGPFSIGGIQIETEWRSDWKWNRIASHIEWRDRRVLDVGCGNGYFGWRMLDAGANCVVGLDPFLLFVVQHEIIKRLAGDSRNHVLPLTDACLPPQLRAFDIAVSMGVLYHRTSPIDHLQMLRESLKSGGQLVMETLIIESDEETVLVPQARYAKMRNVWFIPSPSMLKRWLERAGFRDINVVDISPTTSNEQRRTDWMTFESLDDFLDPTDLSRTVEGYPAPVRAAVTAWLP